MTEFNRRNEFSAQEMHEGLLAIRFLAHAANVGSYLVFVGSFLLNTWHELGDIATPVIASSGLAGIAVSAVTAHWAGNAAEQYVPHSEPSA